MRARLARVRREEGGELGARVLARRSFAQRLLDRERGEVELAALASLCMSA